MLESKGLEKSNSSGITAYIGTSPIAVALTLNYETARYSLASAPGTLGMMSFPQTAAYSPYVAVWVLVNAWSHPRAAGRTQRVSWRSIHPKEGGSDPLLWDKESGGSFPDPIYSVTPSEVGLHGKPERTIS